MLAHMHRHWTYTNVTVKAVQALLDEGLVSEQRAREMQGALGEPARLAASLASLEAGRVDNAAMAVACDCALLYQEAALSGAPDKGDFLALATRAMMLEDLPESFIRVSLSALLHETRQRARRPEHPSHAC